MKRTKQFFLLLIASLAFAALLAGCGGASEQADVNLSEVLGSLQKEIVLDETMQDFTADKLAALCGVSSADMLQFAGVYTGVGILADEIILIQAKDAEAADRIEAGVKERYEKKCAEMKDYLPAEYDKLLASTVLRKGNYVALLVSSEHARMEEIFNAAFQS